MTNSEMMRRAITAGDHDDATVAAALDALRESEGRTLLVAVCELADVVRAGLEAKSIAAAARMLAEHSPLREVLVATILDVAVADASNATTICVIGGAHPPRSHRNVYPLTDQDAAPTITVGSEWVIDQGNALQLEREARRTQPRGLTTVRRRQPR